MNVASDTAASGADTGDDRRVDGGTGLVAAARRAVVPFLVAVAVLSTVTTVAGLAIGADLGSWVNDTDRRVSDALVAGRSVPVVDLSGLGVLFAEPATVAVLWVLAMAAAYRATRAWAVPMFLLVAVGGEKLTYLISSVLVARPRPAVEPIGTMYATGSFPSGHVGSAITLYGGVALAVLWHRRTTRREHEGWPVRAVVGAAVVAIAGIVAWSRLVRGHHHLSDVVWGAAAGVVWLVLGWWIVLRRADSGTTTRWAR